MNRFAIVLFLCIINTYVFAQQKNKNAVNSSKKKIDNAVAVMENKFKKTITAFKNYYSTKEPLFIYEDKIASHLHIYDTIIGAGESLEIEVNGSLEKDKQQYYVLANDGAYGIILSAFSSSAYYTGPAERERSFPPQYFKPDYYKKYLNEDYADTSIGFIGATYQGSLRRIVIKNSNAVQKYIKLLYFEKKESRDGSGGLGTKEYANRKNAKEKNDGKTNTATAKPAEKKTSKQTASKTTKKYICGTCNGKITIKEACSNRACINGVTGYKTETEKRQEGAYMRTITKKIPIYCTTCNGNRYIYYTCTKCNGTGEVE